MWIFWLQTNDQGSTNLVYSKSTNHGATWSQHPETLCKGVSNAAISATALDNNVYVAYGNSDKIYLEFYNGSDWINEEVPTWHGGSPAFWPAHLYAFYANSWTQHLALFGPAVFYSGGTYTTALYNRTLFWSPNSPRSCQLCSEDTFGPEPHTGDIASVSVDFWQNPDESLRLRTIERRDLTMDSLWYRRMTWIGQPKLATAAADPISGLRGVMGIARGKSDACIHLIGAGVGLDTFVFYRSVAGYPDEWLPVDKGMMPSIAMNSDYPWVCYARHDSILAVIQTSDTSWRSAVVFSGSSSSRPGPPTVAAFQGTSGRMGNAAFPVYNQSSNLSQILFAQFDTLGNIVLDTVDEFSGSLAESCACVACGVSDSIHVTYMRGDTVFYRYLLYSPTDQNRPGAWSGPIAVDQPTTMKAFYPSCQEFKGHLYVSFLAKPRVSVGVDTSVIQRCSRDLSNPNVVWEGLEDLSDRNTIARGYYPSVSTDEVAVWSESLAGGKWQVVALVRDSLVALTSPDSVCKFCAVVAETAIASSPSTSTIKLSYLFYTKLAGDTWEARYASKDVKVSNADANVSKYNNGRKLLIDDNDQLAAVWRSNVGAVYYSEREDDPAAGWTNHSVTLVNSDVPCLDRDYLGINWVACRSGSSRKIDGAYSTGNPSSWTVQTVYDCGQYNQTHTKCGPPSIAACRSDPNSQNHTACYFAFTTFREDHDSSFVVFVKTNASGTVIDCDTLDRATPRTDSFASISIRGTQNGDYISVAWQRDNDIFYRVTTSAIDPASTSAISWSNTYNLSNTQAVSRHPQVCCASDSLVVAWAEGSTPAVVAKRQSAGSAYNSWGSQTAVSYATDTCCDYPTISLGDSTIIAYHKMVDTLTSDIWVNINFQSDAAHNLNITNSPTPSKYPHVAFEMHDGTTPVIHTVWTEVLTPNYHEMGYRRWDPTQSGGGGEMSADVYDASIEPELASPRPNPFGHSTTISYAVNRAGNTTLKVFDLSGRTVRTLADGRQKPGRYSCTWNRQDDQGRKLPEGVYFVRLKSPNFEKTRKAVITE